MPPWTSLQARSRPFLPMLRELVRAYQAFERLDAAFHRQAGLTPSQADVLFTLGNTEGMTCKELGERTLITKGTLTGILDRLEGKGLVRRRPCEQDGRSFIVVLTARGASTFEDVFPPHIRRLEEPLEGMKIDDIESLQAQLRGLRARLESASIDRTS